MDDCWSHILLLCNYQTCNQISNVDKNLNHIVKKCWYAKYIHDQLPYKIKSFEIILDAKWYYKEVYDNDPNNITGNWIYQYDKLPYESDWQYKYIHMINVLNLRKDHLHKLDYIHLTSRIINVKKSIYPFMSKPIIKNHSNRILFNTSITIYKNTDSYHMNLFSVIYTVSIEFINQYLLDLIYHES